MNRPFQIRRDVYMSTSSPMSFSKQASFTYKNVNSTSKKNVSDQKDHMTSSGQILTNGQSQEVTPAVLHIYFYFIYLVTSNEDKFPFFPKHFSVIHTVLYSLCSGL
jgi:hypothetical protein